MPYVTDDDSKAAQRITEIRAAVARGKNGVRPMADDGRHADNAAELAQRERRRQRP